MLPSTKLDISLWCRCFLSFFDYDSDSRPHFRSESDQRLIYYKKLESLSIGEEFVRSIGNYCYHPLNWIYLYDADVFFHFRLWFGFYTSFPLRISPVIHIFQRLDTLSLGEEFVRNNGNYCYHPKNWIYLYDADVLFQFSIMIRILDLISGPNQSSY